MKNKGQAELGTTDRKLNGWDEVPGFSNVQDLVDQGALFVCSHSGGKDSQAMYIGMLDAGIPADQILVTYAILPDDMVWEKNADHIRNTIDTDSHFIVCHAQTKDEALKNSDGFKSFWAYVEKRFQDGNVNPMPDAGTVRYCTSDFKTGPVNRDVNAYAVDNGFNIVIMCLGLRGLESGGREKAPIWKLNTKYHGKVPRGSKSKTKRTWLTWLPIKDWTARDAFTAIDQAGQKPHYIYRAGMRRNSCCFCIFACPEDIRTAAIAKPELFATYVAKEQRYQSALMMPVKSVRLFLEAYAGITVDEAGKLNQDLQAGRKVEGIIPVDLDNPIGDPSLAPSLEPCDIDLEDKPKKKRVIVIDRTA